MFVKNLSFMAIPIAIQTLLFSSKSFVDTFLLAEVSAEDVSATGIIGRVMLVVIITILGVSTGGGYVSAQCAQDNKKLNSSIATTLLISIGVALFIFLAVTLFSTPIITLFTSAPAIILLAQTYLNIVLPSLLLLAVSSVLASYLRIINHSSWVSAIISVGVIINIVSSAIMIYQYDMGIAGAAYGTLLGSIFELIALGGFVFYKKGNFLRAVEFSKRQFATIREQIITATASSVVWSLGAFVFYSFLGRSSPEALHAISVIIPIESLLLSLTMGIATASSIMIGKSIPHESKDDIYKKSLTSISFAISSILFIVAIFSLFQDSLVAYFNQHNLSNSLQSYVTLMMFGVVVKSLSIQVMNGIIRSGGDGRFCMRLDIIMQWIIIIPTSYLLLSLGVNPLYIYALVIVEELVKAIIALHRFKTDKWRNNLAAA